MGNEIKVIKGIFKPLEKLLQRETDLFESLKAGKACDPCTCDLVTRELNPDDSMIMAAHQYFKQPRQQNQRRVLVSVGKRGLDPQAASLSEGVGVENTELISQ